MKRKILALLLVLCMIASLLPTIALAGDESAKGTAAELLALFNTALADGGNGVVSLDKDYDLSGGDWAPLKLTKDLTINGNNHTISNLSVKGFSLEGWTSTPVANPESGHDASYYTGFIGNIASGKTVTINNVTFDNAYVDAQNLRSDSSGSSILAVVVANNNGTLTYNDVNVTNSTVKGYGKAGLLHGFSQGGSFVANHCSVSNSHVVVEADGTDTEAGYCGLLIGYNGSSNRSKTNGIKITNCDITIDESVKWPTGTWYTKEDGTKYVLKGTTYWGVTSPTYTHGSEAINSVAFVAEVDGYQYETLEAAIAAAEATVTTNVDNTSKTAEQQIAATYGATVKLLQNITVAAKSNDNNGSNPFYITKDITIDLNGHNITGTDTRVFYVKSGTLKLTGTGVVGNTGTETKQTNDTSKYVLTDGSSVIRVGDGSDYKVTNGTVAGLILDEHAQVSSNRCYGVSAFGGATNENVIIAGKIEAPAPFGTNGQDVNTSVNITLTSTSLVKGTGADGDTSYALYFPAAGTYTIDGTVEGYGGVCLKAGNCNVSVGADAVITATGTTGYYSKSTEYTATIEGTEYTWHHYSSGSATKGYAIAIENNKDYAGATKVSINGGYITGAITIYDDYGEYSTTDSTKYGLINSEKQGKIEITGGYFTRDPSKYVKADYEATLTNVTGYVYEVGTKSANTTTTVDASVGTVKAATGDTAVKDTTPTVTGSSNVTANDVTAAAGSVAVSETSVSALASATDQNAVINSAIADEVSEKDNGVSSNQSTAEKIEAIKNDAVTTLNNALGDGSNVTAKDLSFYTQTYMEVEAKSYSETADGEDTVYSLSMEITPKVQLVVSTAKSADDIELKSEGNVTQNAVKVGTAQTLKVTQPVEVSVNLPSAAFTKDTEVYIEHKAADGKTYVYKATVGENGSVTFTTKNGFSPFTFSTKDTTKAYLGKSTDDEADITRYTSLQEAVNAVKDGGTITIGADNTENIVVAKTISFYVASKDAAYTTNIKAGNYTKLTTTTVGNSTLYQFVYTAPVYGNGDNNTDDEPGGDDDTPTATGTFTDVPDGQWYSDAVAYCAANNLMDGTGNGKFEPMKNVTRAMAITTLYRLAGSPEVSGTNNFTDLTQDWYKAAVQWGVNIGITNGKTATTFDPNAAITREQLAAMFYRYATAMNLDTTAKADLSGYTDSGKISSYAVDAMQWANAAGIVTGTSATTLAPTNTSNRATLATILMRFNENNKTE